MHGWAPLGGSGAKGCKKNGPQSCQIDISQAFGALIFGPWGPRRGHRDAPLFPNCKAPRCTPAPTRGWVPLGGSGAGGRKKSGPKSCQIDVVVACCSSNCSFCPPAIHVGVQQPPTAPRHVTGCPHQLKASWARDNGTFNLHELLLGGGKSILHII